MSSRVTVGSSTWCGACGGDDYSEENTSCSVLWFRIINGDFSEGVDMVYRVKVAMIIQISKSKTMKLKTLLLMFLYE